MPKSSKAKDQGSTPSSALRLPRARLLEDEPTGVSDEEIEEDEAFNSDDERRYGAFFANKNVASNKTSDDQSDESSTSSSENDEALEGTDDDSDHSDQGDGGQYMLDLLNQIDANDKKSKTDRGDSLVLRMAESQDAMPNNKGEELTLDTLMSGLQDTAGFGTLQKAMKGIASGKSTSTPAARVMTERADREVEYKSQSKNVSEWMSAVQGNRQAETLDFRPKERLTATRESWADSFVPTTDFEKQINAALQQAGAQDEEALLQKEEQMLHDDLGRNDITVEEYKKRRSQLAKMRALMFYHEQKRHHMNKIKSKTYRRIRKRQRARQQDAQLEADLDENPDLARELQEKEELERAKERMTLAHKNTSKWAKRILRRGKNVDKTTRQALSAQVQHGDDLRRRMHETRRHSDDESDESDNEDKLIESARQVLTDDPGASEASKNGLFKLAFMQRGVEKQRETAKQEARQLLYELQTDNAEAAEAAGHEIASSMDDPPSNKKASKAEMQALLSNGDFVVSSRKKGSGDAVSLESAIDVGSREPAASRSSSLTANFTVEQGQAQAVDAGTSAFGPARRQVAMRPKSTSDYMPDDGVNPWVVDSKVPKTKSSKSANVRDKGPKRAADFLDVDRAIARLDSAADQDHFEQVAGPRDLTADSGKKIVTLSQAELVRRAFSTGDEKDADEEFAKEKQLVEAHEDGKDIAGDKVPGNVAGWGSWAGKGAPAPGPPRKLPKRLQAPEKKVEKRKREDAKKPHVILSEKRIKRTANQFMISEIPYPFTTREEYERSMSGAIGREWNVTSAVKDMTRAEVLTRPGKIIQPLSKKLKQKRAPAKF